MIAGGYQESEVFTQSQTQHIFIYVQYLIFFTSQEDW